MSAESACLEPWIRRSMNITYCWTEPSGYLAACVDELARRPGVSVTLIHWETAAEAPFDLRIFDGLKTRCLTRAERDDETLVRDVVSASSPDVVIFAGWSHRPYVRLLDAGALRGARFVMTADTALRFDWRQRLAPLRIGRLLRRVDGIMVPGERGYQVMRSWGVPGSKIAKLIYGIDYDRFASSGTVRFAGEWPRRFLYVGRYVPEKAIDVLVAAYRAYRKRVDSPWPLTTCGVGPQKAWLAGVEGIEDRGFLQPGKLGEAFAGAGAFLLPSRYEPWGQAIVEAGASGLPVICSQECGAGADVVRDFHSGLVIPSDDVEATCRAMEWMHRHHDRLPAMGREIQHSAAAYGAARWADNQIAFCSALANRGRPAAS